jgi:hypothetical protein
MSLQESDKAAAAVATAPRVSLADIEASIGGVFHMTGDKAIGDAPQMPSLALLSICIIVMRNGFTIIGKSAPASAANFNADLGRRLAYEDAVRQIWPLMGFALRERLAAA